MQLNSPAEILKLLDGSNCRKCKLPTCSAFASSVFVGKRKLNECSKLSGEEIEKHAVADTGHNSIQQQMEETLAQLKLHIASIDFSSVAKRLGIENAGVKDVVARDANNEYPWEETHSSAGNEIAKGESVKTQTPIQQSAIQSTAKNVAAQSPATAKITIHCLGKNFTVDKNGNIETDIHVNPWLAIPILNYIIDGKGVPLSGKWVSLRDLPNGRSRYPLFARRCEESLRKLADTYKNLFEDMLDIFDGKQLSFHYPCDIVVVLYPLPLIPVLICYLEPEDDMDSELKIFFDANSEENLDIESIYKLVTGIVMMFEKLAIRHS